MAELLRGDEILACVHRVALVRGAPFPVAPPTPSGEREKRRRDAEGHRRGTLEEFGRLHPDAVWPRGADETMAALDAGATLVLAPRLADDVAGRRRATVHALVRVGRVDDRYVYSPVLIKNNEVLENAPTRRILEGSLARALPSEAEYTDGVGLRGTLTVTRSGLTLAHALRVLEAAGHADPTGRVALIDRHRRLWWLDLDGADYPRFNLATYNDLYAQRLAVLDLHDAWDGGEFPTTPYWHRECLECPFEAHCREELEARDDVSLVRFTNLDQQILLREHGVTTRAALARLDPLRARLAHRRVPVPHESFEREDHLGRVIDKLDDLIYRARAHQRASSLRIADVDAMGCPTADVEVDVDMESYGDATYLWGAVVSLGRPVEGVADGYHAFAEFGELTPVSEARNFAAFWEWFAGLRELCASRDLTFAAYCFWAQAEDGAMNRAVETPLAGGPTAADLDELRRRTPREWIDLHDLAKAQIQTEGPLGLKQLATGAGFRWRDAHPSGEASMLWYEIARGEGDEALAQRRRLLEYNEDDCRATKALRDWLNGPARDLPHRDDPLENRAC